MVPPVAAAYDISAQRAVLPLLSLSITAAAVVMFLWRAPFSLVEALFCFPRSLLEYW
jgi:hypothetical protein